MSGRLGAFGPYSLRKPERVDVEVLYSIKNDAGIANLLVGTTRTFTRADLVKWVDFHREAADEAFFIVADAEDRAVGHVALYGIDRVAGTAEFGILLGDRSIWGQGVGTHYTRFMIEYGFDSLGLRRIWLEVLDSNPRARGLYERLGFVVEGRLRQHRRKSEIYVDVLVMGLLRDEYQRDAS